MVLRQRYAPSFGAALSFHRLSAQVSAVQRRCSMLSARLAPSVLYSPLKRRWLSQSGAHSCVGSAKQALILPSYSRQTMMIVRCRPELRTLKRRCGLDCAKTSGSNNTHFADFRCILCDHRRNSLDLPITFIISDILMIRPLRLSETMKLGSKDTDGPGRWRHLMS